MKQDALVLHATAPETVPMPLSQGDVGVAPLSLEQRNALILEYLPLVKFVAGRLYARLPKHAIIELSDLVDAGIIGLIDAIDKFDDGRKIKFKTYAEFRIKGVMLDELRSLDWVPRSTRTKASRVTRATAALEQRLGRSASDDQLREFLGIEDVDAFYALLQEAEGIGLIRLEELQSRDFDDSESVLAMLADEEAPNPLEIVMADQLRQILHQTIDRLTPKQQAMIGLYYFQDVVMKTIGATLSVSESRVSQIHTEACQRLRRILTREGSFDESVLDGHTRTAPPRGARRRHIQRTVAAATQSLSAYQEESPLLRRRAPASRLPTPDPAAVRQARIIQVEPSPTLAAPALVLPDHAHPEPLVQTGTLANGWRWKLTIIPD